MKIKNKFLLVIVFLVVFGFLFTLNIERTLAQSEDPVIFTPQVTIPFSKFQKGEDLALSESTRPIGEYIKSIYNYLLAVTGLLAAIVLMTSGIIWLTAAGNTTRISQAKNWMTGSVTGLVLMFLSFLILNTINPSLVNFKIQEIKNIKELEFELLEVDKEDLPDDAELGMLCQQRGERCQGVFVESWGIKTSLITVKNEVCIEYFGDSWHQKSSECVISSDGKQRLYCCAKSGSEKNRFDNFCQGKTNGTSCYLSITDVLKTGYCENNKCNQCISGNDQDGKGIKCTQNYQCSSGTNSSCGTKSPSLCMFYVMDVFGKKSEYGYCYKEFFSTEKCENKVGGGCFYDPCCSGLCCSRVGITPVCIPGKQQSGSDKCLGE